MASVYAATHTSGRRAAFEILHAAHKDDDELRTRFLEEHRLSQLIEHPDRVAVYGIRATDDGLPALFMELLEGETRSDEAGYAPRIFAASTLNALPRPLWSALTSSPRHAEGSARTKLVLSVRLSKRAIGRWNTRSR